MTRMPRRHLTLLIVTACAIRPSLANPVEPRIAFDPGHFVPGIGPSPDKMLQGRLFAYGDAHRYRLGINHTRIPVNAPNGVTGGATNYGRDGAMRVEKTDPRRTSGGTE